MSYKYWYLRNFIIIMFDALPPCRDIALRIIPDAVQCVSSFAEFDLLLDVVFALASDYGRNHYII